MSLSTPTPPPTAPTEIPIDGDIRLGRDDITLYPGPDIYAGENVTFQLLPDVPDGIAVQDVEVEILVDGTPITQSILTQRNWAGQAQGIYEWVWHTAETPITHTVTVSLDPNDKLQNGDPDPSNNSVSFEVAVLDPSGLPVREQEATWISAETDCCILYAISNTAAARDLYLLTEQVDSAVAQASQKIDEPLNQKINIYFTDRIIGQGGFAGADMVIAYVDRQYNGGNLHELLVHEATHVIDRQFAPERIRFLAEGLAVWSAGGHYKPENLTERSAALYQIGEYIPLTDLINDFYPVQHEIGYLQAAGFVTYLIDSYGWANFRTLYANASSSDAATDAEAIDLNLQQVYNRSLASLEAEWLNSLSNTEVSEEAIIDLTTTIRFYNVMRRYQLAYDPPAHFLSAWLPMPRDVRTRGNTADFTRRPESETIYALEAMLLEAEEDLETGNFNRANVTLDSITRVLDNEGAFLDPVAASYREIVRQTSLRGYQTQRIELEGDSAVVYANTANNPVLIPIELRQIQQGWALAN